MRDLLIITTALIVPAAVIFLGLAGLVILFPADFAQFGAYDPSADSVAPDYRAISQAAFAVGLIVAVPTAAALAALALLRWTVAKLRPRRTRSQA